MIKETGNSNTPISNVIIVTQKAFWSSWYHYPVSFRYHLYKINKKNKHQQKHQQNIKNTKGCRSGKINTYFAALSHFSV